MQIGARREHEYFELLPNDVLKHYIADKLSFVFQWVKNLPDVAELIRRKFNL
jgi:hypothetical protein